MDSPKSSNRWKAVEIAVAFVMGIPGWIAMGLMLWYRRYPDPTTEPDVIGQAGVLATGWLPLIVVSASSLLSALMFLLVIVKRFKNKNLKTRLADLEKDLELEKAKVEAEKGNVTDAFRQIKNLKDDLIEADRKSKIEVDEADKRTNEQRRQKDIAIAELEKREADLAELKTLRDMRYEQSQKIKDHVIAKAYAGDLILQASANCGPCATLELRIRNESLFNISIRPEDVKGSLAFQDRPFPERISVIIDTDREPITDLKPFEWGSIVLHQPLRIADVEWIKSLQVSPKGRFRLAALCVPITAVDSQYKVPVKNLRITPEIEYLAIDAFRVTKSLDADNKM